MDESIKIKRIKKGTILLHQGEISRYGYRVTVGCLKSYIIDKADKEHILQFAPEKWMIGDMKSSLENVPSTIFIEAIEDSEVELIESNELRDFSNYSKEELIQINHILVRNIIATNQRVKLLLSSTAEERYLDFIKTYPSLIQRLPLKLIASYLGMTPEYLSDVRKKLARK